MASRPRTPETAAVPRVRLDILDHVVVFVEDFERALEFYREVLGLPVRVAHEGWAEFGTRGAGIALHSGGKKSRGAKDYRKGGILPTIRVQSIESAVAYLQSRGVKVTEINLEAFGRLAVFSDPEGNQLQLLEPHE